MAYDQKPIIPTRIQESQRDLGLSLESARCLFSPWAHPESGNVRDYHLALRKRFGGHELRIGEPGVPETVQTEERGSPATTPQVVNRGRSLDHSGLQTVSPGQLFPEGEEVLAVGRGQRAGTPAVRSERRLRSAAKNRMVSTTTPMARA